MRNENFDLALSNASLSKNY